MLKRLGARPWYCDKINGFSLPSHTNLSPLQSSKVIADLFSQISQEYPPMDITTLPHRISWILQTTPKSQVKLSHKTTTLSPQDWSFPSH